MREIRKHNSIPDYTLVFSLCKIRNYFLTVRDRSIYNSVHISKEEGEFFNLSLPITYIACSINKLYRFLTEHYFL